MRHLLLAAALAVLCAAGPVPQQVPAETTRVATEPVPPLSEAFELTAASPNPFRTQTKFTLRVQQSQRVEVSVYNVLGQKVRSLHDGWTTGGLEYDFTFQASNLPSGIYLYRVRGEGFVATRRVTLLS